jgi:hypothetical protein
MDSLWSRGWRQIHPVTCHIFFACELVVWGTASMYRQSALCRHIGSCIRHLALCSGTDTIFIPGLSFPEVAARFVIVDDGKEFRSGVVTPQEAMTHGSLLLKR